MCSELPLGVDVLIYSAPLGRILSLISLLRVLAVSELPTGSDEVRKEADSVLCDRQALSRCSTNRRLYRAARRFAVHSTGGLYLVFRGGVQVRLK